MDIEEHPGWHKRSPLCTCLPDWSGDCPYHDFDKDSAEAASAAIDAYMTATGQDPDDEDAREACSILLDPVLDVYIAFLAGKAYYSFSDILPFLQESAS